MRRCMEESEMKSSPTLMGKSYCLVPNRLTKDNRLVHVVEEEIQDIDVDRIKLAVERLSDSGELIADCSRPYTLPVICGKHKDLKSIHLKLIDQLTDLFGGEYNQFHTSFTIIDCRYPYEYNGGHIQGAVNIYTKQLRYMRSQDRVLNSQNYPRLYYPEVYILHGGYEHNQLE
ncbi:M-phase inducer phosphatase 3-like [Patella vulgata]|uniref:M-phase inducer phosphatase 3-like n=1 Tax=Patella vulgata TaxID=6465 RepID=UPI00217F50B7|nr:M-phase inducer phosphatase 3-like [Patella vulgata]